MGPYEITGLLGRGGMGEVYRARDARLGRDVAIKVLPAAFAADPERMRRFELEARAVAALEHSNILAIHDVGVDKGSPYLVTELLEGQSLEERLDSGPLPVRKVVETAVQIAQGLAAAHARGIVHRDLKPRNVFVTKGGQVKILDFGIAKLVGTRTPEERARATTVSGETDEGVTVGTVGYMSPEQVRGQPLDQRSDIFSFGCVLYEMLAGQAPFHRQTAPDTNSAILHDDPPSLVSAGRAVPSGLAGIVTRCLEKQPEDRLSSAHDLALALQGELATFDAPAPTPGVRSRRLLAWAVLSVLAVVGAAAIAFFASRGRERRRVTDEAGRIRSIAVLPLVNLSGDAGQEYFSDGMTEELTATLSRISSVKVISRTSAMQFKGTKKPLREIAATLGVEGVLEGSVLRVGDRIRITAQLIHAASDTHVWAESYERDLRDVLTLQSEVARAIVAEIRATVTPEEQSRLARARPVVPEAYAVYLRGCELLQSYNEGEFRLALGYLQRAIELDPTYAPAHAAIGTFFVEGGSRGYQAPSETIPKARAALRRALALDDGVAEAHAALGNLLFWYDWDWAGAEVELRRAIALAPNSSVALDAHAEFLGAIGRPDDAVSQYRLALERDPLAPNKNFRLGTMLYYAGRYDESLAQLHLALQTQSPDAEPMVRTVLAMNYGKKSMKREALVECGKAIAAPVVDQRVLCNCGSVFGRLGLRSEALAVKARVEHLSDRQYVDPTGFALIFDGLGNDDAAMRWLERAFRERAPNLWALQEEPWTDRLRSDPRFQDLVRRMNFPGKPGP